MSINDRNGEQGSAVEAMPPEVWDSLEYTSIHAAILFADLEHSVLLSSTSDPREYQRLINSTQAAMLELVQQLKADGQPVQEFTVAGDQLALFFYNPEEVQHNWLLDGPKPLAGTARGELVERCRKANQALAYAPLEAAIKLKTHWLCQDFNLKRVREHREPLALGMGIHYGRVYLCLRPDGRRRIEGYAVNLAKRIEGFSRQGNFSRIMLSRDTYNSIRGTIRKHTMLRQRIYFAEHQVGLELLRGITRSQPVYELKFYSRIGLRLDAAAVAQYEALFAIDPANLWAYYQLFEYYAYAEKNWDRAYQLARRAHLLQPSDEKILLDLARCCYNLGNRDQARRFAAQALEVNPQFDLVLEFLAVLAAEEGRAADVLEYFSRALSLTPGSPINHLNLGLQLCKDGKGEQGCYHLEQAILGYPAYLHEAAVVSDLRGLLAAGLLPQEFGGRFPLLSVQE